MSTSPQSDLSATSHFDEVDQARLFTILQAYMDRTITQDEIKNYYLEFFPRPERWEDYQDEEGPSL